MEVKEYDDDPEQFWKLWAVASGFFGKMVAKLIHQAGTHEYWGYFSEESLKKKLLSNVEHGDWAGVAYLAMILDYRAIKAQKEGNE